MRIPNNETLVLTHTALPPPTQLPQFYRKCDVFPSLQQLLLSFGQLYNVVFKAILDSETVQLSKEEIATLSGTRYHSNRLYFILIKGYPTPPHPTPPLQKLSNQHCPH